MFSATLEIVMSSYNINSQGNFTWILETFNLEAYQFYKVIEIIIRAEDGLARDMVKHLQVPNVFLLFGKELFIEYF